MARATSTVVVPPFSDTVQPGQSMLDRALGDPQLGLARG